MPKIRQLLFAISESAPFIPNISKLSERIGIARETLLNYIQNLSDAQLLTVLYKETKGISRLQKPDKIFLQNTNIMYALGKADQGNLRETFFVNQMSNVHRVTYSEIGDFKVDNTYLFEIGGENKTRKQLAKAENAFIASDNIEIGFDNKIPLYLFGFLY